MFGAEISFEMLERRRDGLGPGHGSFECPAENAVINLGKDIAREVVDDFKLSAGGISVVINKRGEDLGESPGRAFLSSLKRVPKNETPGPGKKSPKYHDVEGTYSHECSRKQGRHRGIAIVGEKGKPPAVKRFALFLPLIVVLACFGFGLSSCGSTTPSVETIR